MSAEALATEKYWDDLWHKRLGEYLAASPRTGLYLDHRLRGRVDGVLEVAAGSARDSIFLGGRGYRDVVATDFCTTSIAELKRLFPDRAGMFEAADGYALPFSDKSFDVVFHNGFFAVIRDDADIVRLLREQMRLARKWVVALVHNAENPRLRNEYETGAKKDQLYDIRFFTRQDMLALAAKAGVPARSVRFEKFGGPADVIGAESIRGIKNPFRMPQGFPPYAYQLQPWNRVERIACWIETN